MCFPVLFHYRVCFICILLLSVGKDEGKEAEKKDSTAAPPAGFGFGKPGSAQGKRTLSNVNTHFYCGTEVNKMPKITTLLPN